MANLIVGAALLGAAALAIRYIWKSHKSEKIATAVWAIVPTAMAAIDLSKSLSQERWIWEL